MAVKVSVIIPIYNGENYLEQCLDSVCGQTLKEIEIICVDDGSTDSSVNILKKYQAGDPRIQIIKQTNLYAGAARNNGKAHATGEYLMFWDCDDFFELNALELLYNQAKEKDADICICGGNQYYDNKKQLYPFPGYLTNSRVPEGNLFNRENNEDYILNVTNEAPWNKMFKRAYIEGLNLDFQQVRNGNDVFFSVVAICMAGRITTVNQPLVNYRKNQKGSLVGTLYQSPDTPFRAWISAAEYLEAHNAFPERSFVNKVTGSTMYLLRNMKTEEAFYKVVDFLKKEGLEKLHVREREDGFYYNKVHPEFVHHLIHDEPNDFRSYLLDVTYFELTDRSADLRVLRKEKREWLKEEHRLNKLIEKQEKEIKDLRESWSYRIGRKLMWLPGKIKRMNKNKNVKPDHDVIPEPVYEGEDNEI